jgi:hypothetical protein
MSSINTNGINPNYPVPGVNNSSQGFRDNFTSIKTNLDTAYTEITDIQTKAIVKSPLAGIPINNDMGNTLISNALVKGFRATTYNLGNSISGITTIDLSKGDVQYGTIAGNSSVNLQFINWAPAGTQSNVQVYLTAVDANTFINLPNSIGSSVDSSANFIENYYVSGSNKVLSFASGAEEVKLRFSTIDCGKTITIEPINKPKVEKHFDIPTVANVVLTGNITKSSGSNLVSGSGTQFTTQLAPGTTLIDSANVFVGIVDVIANNVSLTLQTSTSAIVSGAAYGKQVPIGDPSDKPGHIKVSTDYLYACFDDYDGSSPIWKRIPLDRY